MSWTVQWGGPRSCRPRACLRTQGTLITIVMLALAFSNGCRDRGHGSPTPAQLLVRPGTSNPGSSQALTTEADVAVLQVALEATSEDVEITRIGFQASGSGDDATGISESRLYRDVDGDGTLGAGDIQLGAGTTYGSDDGDLLFSSLSETILAGNQVDWLLVYDVGPGLVSGDTFCADLRDETGIVARVGGQAARISVGAGIQGCVTTTTGTLTLAPGPASPPARLVSVCATGEVVLQLDLLAGPLEDVVVDSATFTASGTGDDSLEIAAASLHVDNNENAVLDASDTPLGGPALCSADDGTVTFPGLSRTIAASSREAWILVYDLSSSVSVGSTFAARVAANAGVAATGAQTMQAIPVVGAPVPGDAITVADPLLLSATYVDANENGIVDLGDTLTVTFATDVAIQGTPSANLVFDLDPSGLLGGMTRVGPGGGPAEVEMVLQPAGISLQPNGRYPTDPGASGLNLNAFQVGITNCAGSPLQPLSAPIDVSGEANPRIDCIAFADGNQNGVVDSGDTLDVHFTASVTFTTSDPGQAFQLPVSGDSLGAGAQFMGGGTPAGVQTATVVLGTSPSLTILDGFDPSRLAPGDASGLDVSATSGLVVDAAYASVSAAPYTPPGWDIGTAQAWTSVGDDQMNARFGATVAPAGDVNNDGYADVIIGAYSQSTPTSGAGKAFVYHGGPAGLGTTPAWTSSGDDQAGASFGWSVASAGDVDQDGYSDVIVSARSHDAGNGDAGKAYLYHGGPSGLSTTPMWTSSGDDQLRAFYGSSVASAGDANNDGYADVLVGAFNYDTGNAGAGKAYLYLGGPTGLSPSSVWTSSGDDQSFAVYGSSVASAGDVNGDGFDDAIVGAPGYQSTPLGYEGKAYLYFGEAGGLGPSSVWSSLGDDQIGAGFGISVAGAGDVDQNGFADVIVGADGFATANGVVGRAYVFLGASGGLAMSPSWMSSGDERGEAAFGGAVASAGDLDGDGFSDIIVGASGHPASDSGGEGKAYVYLGGPGGPSVTPGWTSSGDFQVGALFGWSIASAGDVDMSGRTEVIVGARNYDASSPTTGKVYLYPMAP